MEKGFENVSLGEIVRRSGGSLSTLYDMFDNKQGLLRAVMRSKQVGRVERLQQIARVGASPFETLRMAALELSAEFLSFGGIALMRNVVAESLRDPDFARDMYEEVHLPFVAAIEELFAGWKASGKSDMPCPRRAALFFIGMVLHPPQSRGLCGDLPSVAAELHEAACAEAAALFVRGYGLDD